LLVEGKGNSGQRASDQDQIFESDLEGN